MADLPTRLLHAVLDARDGLPSDADLLAQAAAGEAAAFELLVRRHAGLVWRVCRRVARDHHAAEDAFQAAFLALIRRGATVRERSAAGWLHRVAYHAAVKARPGPRAEFLADEPLSPAPPPDQSAETTELARLLHAEVDRLPDRYRLPVVLCHLEGCTQLEAAARLGLPVGTLSTRVRRGCDRLRDRLTRRGIGLPAAGVAAALAGADVPAVSAPLIALTAGFGPGGGLPGPGAASLTTGALHAMRYLQLKAPLAVAVAVAVTAAGVAWSVGQTPPPERPAASEPMKPAGPAVGSDAFQRRDAVNRMRLLGQAVHQFMDANDGRLPADLTDGAGRPVLSWRVALLPHLGADYQYAQFHLDEPWDSEHNRKLLPHVPKVYQTPGAGETRVQGFVGPTAAFERGRPLRVADFTDGTVGTLLAVEAGPSVPWTKPADLPFDPKGPPPKLTGPHPDGVAAVAVDGSAFWLPSGVTPKWLTGAVSRNDSSFTEMPPTTPRPPSPPTAAERTAMAEVRERFARIRKLQKAQIEERFRLTEALRKVGPIEPLPAAPAAADLDAWTAAYDQLYRVQQSDLHEISRLWQELARRNPAAASALRKEFDPPPAAKAKDR